MGLASTSSDAGSDTGRDHTRRPGACQRDSGDRAAGTDFNAGQEPVTLRGRRPIP
jgi:hypothetical protein